ncbi:hypothetical protein L3X38_019122 [Prunus dulcis]|uniref:Tetratricopeptide repeat-like superfamily protein n=1 Tax=Prunus dulcis TaxID=3755 RepID=A0AAD4ZBS1_PRUDU|nr:hypothetical protein L3X38_019122 [Prunus dulcis]
MAFSALPLPLSTPSPSTQTSIANPPEHLSSSALPLPKLKTPTIRSRLSKLCQEGQPLLARQLFDTLPRPTTVLWNTIIIGFICNNMPNEALLFYAQMKASSPHIKSDSYTYSSTLKACADTRNFKMGKALHCHVLRCLPNPSRIVCNSLLNMYSACYNDFDYSEYDLVRRVFDTMRKRNVVAWNTLVSWYVKTQRYAEAVKQFRMMMRMRITPSAVSFVNVFPALSAMGDYKNANVLYGMLLRLGDEYVNDLFAVSSATFMYGELGCLDYARKIFDHCLERNTEIWNTMIGASAVVQSRFSQMVLTSVHMAFGSVLGHWDLGQSNVISCHLGKALSVLFRAPEESIYGRGTLHQELKQRTLFSFGH